MLCWMFILTILYKDYRVWAYIRNSFVYKFSNDWFLVISYNEEGNESSYYFIIINAKIKEFYIILSSSECPYLLNDYNNDGIIDFFTVDFISLVIHKNFGDLYLAKINHYSFINDDFEKQNDTIPKNKGIFLSEKCGCYTKEGNYFYEY